MRWDILAIVLIFAGAVFSIGHAIGKSSRPEPATPAIPAERIVQEPERFTTKWKANSLGVPFCVVHDRITGKTSTFIPKEEKQHD
jgi:hypothetical protein